MTNTQNVPGWVAMLIHQARDERDADAQSRAIALLAKRGYTWALEVNRTANP